MTLRYTQYTSDEGYVGDVWCIKGRYVGRLINTTDMIDYEAETKEGVVYAMENSIDSWKEASVRLGFDMPEPTPIDDIEGFTKIQRQIRKFKREKLSLVHLEVAIVELLKEELQYEPK